ncbi:MAG TPA: tetratricopeptide repeat protein [Pyrinomonadaceae bacterium]|nr:tetratricopeptide repeat protein [Pyrinomonadaceae bacterium]
MKTKFSLLVLLLVATTCFAQLFAQTRKTTKRAPTAPKSAEANKTRSRRTGQPSETQTATQPQPSVPKPESTPVPTTTAETEKPATPAKEPVVETVPEAKPAEKPEPTATAVPQDPFAVLRDQIDAAASGPERIQLRLKLVEEFVSAGKRTEALSELHAIVNTDVFDPQGFYNTGNSFARLGETDAAVGAYRKAIEQRKGRYSRAFNNLGVVLLRVGRWDEAYDALLSALKLEAFRYPEASYNLGRLYAARGQSDLAVREWRRVLAQNPDHTAAANALARVGTEGRVVVETVRAPSPRSNTERSSKPSGGETVKAAVAEKPVSTKTSKSVAPASRSLVLDPASFGFLQRARDFSEKGKTVEAVDSYKRLLNRQSGYFPPANLEVSFALMNLKRYDEAQGNLQIVVDRDGARYPISYFHLARLFELKGDLKQAETLFSQAVAAFGSQNAQFLLDVSRVREKQGNFKGALEAMESYLSLMQQHGEQPSWSGERLTSLRQKVGGAPKPE